MKIGVPVNKANKNSRKIPVKELIFTKVTNLIPATLIKMIDFREFYRRFAQILTYLPQYFSTSGQSS